MIKAKEKGQIIVILAVAMVGLLGLTALAIDGSMVYNERRTDQSTADSAALAGAGAAAQVLKDYMPGEFYCGSTPGAAASTAAATASHDSALEDEVNLLINDLSTENGLQVTCGTNNFSRYLDIKVMVTTNTETMFAKLLSRNQLKTTVQSTARVYPVQSLAYGNAIASLSKSCGNIGGIGFGGNSTVIIDKGGVFSNSCLTANSGSTIVTVTGGQVQYYTPGGYASGPNTNISPEPVQASEQLPEKLIDPPNCTAAAYVNAPTSGTINPGNYNGLHVANNQKLTLNKGLYCLKGDLDSNAQSEIYADGVTLYFISGGVKLNAQTKIYLVAPNMEGEAYGVPPAMRGMLMFFDPNNQATVTLNGSSENTFMGTIYGPSTYFKINGSSIEDTINTQIIGNRVELIGGAKLSMNLAGAEMFQMPSSIELLK